MRRTSLAFASGIAIAATLPTVAAADSYTRGDPRIWVPPSAVVAQADQPSSDADRRRPGVPRRAPPVEPAMDPNAVPPPQPNLPREFIPISDRWRLIEAVGVKERYWDPYNQNTLKGDRPIFGNDWFINLGLISDTVFEPRGVPVPVGVATTQRGGSNSLFGKYNQHVVNQNFIVGASLIKGDTAFKPPDLEFRLGPVFNVNYARVDERGILKADPQRGLSRTDSFVGLQEAFIDYHIRNVSDRFDFDSIRVGVQPFSSDFRGFLFQDLQLGVRLFGNRDNNRWQYNLAYFRRFDKDTNSGLNDVGEPLREDDIFIANVYRQDFPFVGFTSQLSYIFNRNNEGKDRHFDKNDFQVRPATIGDQRGRDYRVHYLGYSGDGHWGRLNLTTSLYYAFGTDDHNQFLGTQDSKSDIRAYFGAIEPSIDFDWVRVRLSALYASGDKNPFDKRATGFDAIYENPQFAGADTSYWIRQGIPFIGGGGVGLSGRNGVLASLRSSKDQGQSNFVNPGLLLVGLGTDLDLTPELRLSTNFNYLRFNNTSSLEVLRNQGSISKEIGWDLSAAIIYRPTFIQNIVFRLSGAVLIPGDGLKDLYRTSDGVDSRFLYSVLANLILTY